MQVNFSESAPLDLEATPCNIDANVYLSKLYSRVRQIYEKTQSVAQVVVSYFLNVGNFSRIVVYSHEETNIQLSTREDILLVSLPKNINLLLAAVNSFPNEAISFGDLGGDQHASVDIAYVIIILLARMEKAVKVLSFSPKLCAVLPTVTIRNTNQLVKRTVF